MTLTQATHEQATMNVHLDFAALNKETKHTRHIQYPASKEAQRRWQLEQMAGAFRIFAKLGYADGASGHISLRGVFAVTGYSVDVFLERGNSFLFTPLDSRVPGAYP